MTCSLTLRVTCSLTLRVTCSLTLRVTCSLTLRVTRFPHAEREEYAGRIAIPTWAAAGLAGRLGQPLTLGVRPEDLLPLADDSRPTAALAANVEQIERLGDRTHVYLSVGGQRLTASWSARSPAAVGTAVEVHVDLNRVHSSPPTIRPPAAGREPLPGGEARSVGYASA